MLLAPILALTAVASRSALGASGSCERCPALLKLRGGNSKEEQAAEEAADKREEELLSQGIMAVPARERQLERESKDLSDAALDCLAGRAMARTTTRKVLPSWKGRTGWLWRRWEGTIFETTWPRVLASMTAATLLVAITRATTPADKLWDMWSTPDPAHPVISRLKLLSGGWDLQLTLTTFTTTFFMSHAYAFWRNAYSIARTIQGKLNELALLLSTHAAQDPATGLLTPEARSMLDVALRRLSLAHVLFWAGIVRRAPGSDHFGTSFNQILTTRCLDRLVLRGLLTAQVSHSLPPCEYPSFIACHPTNLALCSVRSASSS